MKSEGTRIHNLRGLKVRVLSNTVFSNLWCQFFVLVLGASIDMYISTKQTCVDYCRGCELSEAVKPFLKRKRNDSPSSQPEPSYHDLNSSEYWLGPFNSKELAQLDASFPQQAAHEIDSQSNVDIARSGISHSKKKNEIERIQNEYGITRQILKQHFGMTLEQAAKYLNVSRSTLKRICKVYGISRWPHHKTRKVYHRVSQGISLLGVADHLVLNWNRSTLVDCSLLDDNDQVPTAPPRATGPVASLLNDLHIAREQNDALRTDIETMRTNLAESQGEVARLKDQLLQQQQDSNARVDQLLKLLASSHSPPPSSS